MNANIDKNNNPAMRVGLWTHLTSRALGHLHEIQDAGFDYIIVKVSDGTNHYWDADARQIVADAQTIDLPVYAWHYTYPDNIEAQIQTVVSSLPEGIADLVIDAEIEWETYGQEYGYVAAASRVDALMHGIAEATGHRVALHLSSFWSPSLHPDFPYKAFLAHCQSWQPQVYLEPGSSRTASKLLDDALEQGDTLMPAGLDLIPTINDLRFTSLLRAQGVANWNVYAWDAGEGDAEVSTSVAAWKDAIAAARNT